LYVCSFVALLRSCNPNNNNAEDENKAKTIHIK
jgi:hypothetical protein